jgi:hypothetical protein
VSPYAGKCNTYSTRQCRSSRLANDDPVTAAVEKHTLSQPTALELRHFMTTNRLLTTRRPSSKDAILRMAMASTHCGWTIFTQKSVDRRSVFYACRLAVTSWHWIILTLSANVGIKPASATALGQESSGTLSWAPLNYLTSYLKICMPLALRQRLWFQHHGTPERYGEEVRRRLNATYPGMWTGRRRWIVRPLRSSDLIPIDFFPMGTPEGACLCSPSKLSWQTSSSCDNSRCQNVKACWRECCAAHRRLL